MLIEAHSPRSVRDIFKSVERLNLRSRTPEDDKLLSDLNRVLVAGSTTRREFARQVAELRARLDASIAPEPIERPEVGAAGPQVAGRQHCQDAPIVLPVERITRAAFDALLEYSLSLPTGVIAGKKWKRDRAMTWRGRTGPHDWVICEFVPGDPGFCRVECRTPEIVEPSEVQS